ncbi:MAG TPA: phosphatidate cytidylyltransferase [Candidatus Monoglobus merdigallinarum]|uniref:Phosphatidate cytidylyltransferase n=1 Tax=Candidatus Monoglobus merdigallinarum TaxID=2838698 RepID=A0A9D1PR39_9FIRM|nr:phosphatidate cytidylyltransferase [Candidatus Monoglobus merdigallinarum]
MKPGLKARVLTAVIGIPIIILILIAPAWVMLIAVILCSLAGLYEFYSAVGLIKKTRLLALFGFLGGAVVPLCHMMPPREIFTCAFLFLFILFLVMLGSHRRVLITDISMLIMGLIYVPFLLSNILYTKQLEYGDFIVWLIFVGAFVTDSCAFFAGKAFGRHKLCPNISPKKTVEGAIGGIVGCGLAFLLFALIVNTFFKPYLGGASMNYGSMFVLGLLSSFAAQVGDLTASLIKRQFGIKDFGSLFPGHGGMLDRCDSIVLVAPTVFLFAAQFSLFI